MLSVKAIPGVPHDPLDDVLEDCKDSTEASLHIQYRRDRIDAEDEHDKKAKRARTGRDEFMHANMILNTGVIAAIAKDPRYITLSSVTISRRILRPLKFLRQR